MGHEWGDLPIIFTSDEATSENYWQITSRGPPKQLFEVTHVLFYFLHAVSYPEYIITLETSIDRWFRHCL